jgi:plastocyanin
VRRTTSERSGYGLADISGRLLASTLNFVVPPRLLRFALVVAVILSMAPRVCAATVSVAMFDKPACFRPQHLVIKVGTTIRWINSGETVHTVTADPDQAPDPSWVQTPSGSELMDSGYMNVGDSYSYDFKVPGIYKYFCLTHEQEGMRGEIDVEK